MFNSSFIFYHYLRKYISAQNEAERRNGICLPEMQKVFSNCSMESDNKIRSSIFIEAITITYGLNDELKAKLENKLDPDNVDLLYSKEELFLIFKDWISSGASTDKSPINIPSCFSPIKFPYSSTPTLPFGSARRRPRMRLFLPDDALFGSDEVDVETTRSSSSTKKLSHHRSVLESKLETFEKHTSSLEKKFEDINQLCAQQKLEIERLKQELKMHHETEQAMEEMTEERRKLDLETERRHSQLQAQLSAAVATNNNLDSELALLKKEFGHALEKIDVYEKEVANEIDKKCKLEMELMRKECLCRDLKNEITILKSQEVEQDSAFAAILEENSVLTNEINELRNKNFSYNSPILEGGGIPLFEELPSEMFLLNDPHMHSGYGDAEQRNDSPELFSRSCQTENEIVSDLYNAEHTVTNAHREISSSLLNYEELNNDNCSRPSYFNHGNSCTVQSQTERNSLQVEDNYSQTEFSLFRDSSSQTDLLNVCSSCQTDPHELYSLWVLSDFYRLNSISSQTEPTVVFSSCSQTSNNESSTSSAQTDISYEQAQDNVAQTEDNSSQTDCFASSAAQTDMFQMHNVSFQTENPSVTFNGSQTSITSTDSIFTQTDLLQTRSQQTELPETTHDSSQTESVAVFSQTEKSSETHSSYTQTELSSSFSQIEVFNLFDKSSQIGGSASAFSSPRNHSPQVLNCLPQICSNTDAGPNQLFDYLFLLRTVVGFLFLFFSYLPSRKIIVRYFYQMVLTICSLLVALIAIFVMYCFVCQNNRCRLELRYPNGRPPV